MNEWHSIIFRKPQFYWNLIIIIITIISYLFYASLRVTEDVFSGRPVVRWTIIIIIKMEHGIEARYNYHQDITIK
jgi:hypothetical protein